MKNVAAFFSGLLFAIGLYISGMTLPENIIGFLDFFGSWKPALALVMVGAVSVYAILSRFVLMRKHPLFDVQFDLPAAHQIDARLIGGAIAFGVGWGLAGLCPGPALVSFGTGARAAVVFVVALIAGVALHHLAGAASGPGGAEQQDACG